MKLDQDIAVVLFSGGQDSTTCLAWALDRYEWVETVGFHYGQRHLVELGARMAVRAAIGRDFPDWAGRLGADKVLSMPAFSEIGDTAMTSEMQIETGAEGLPTTFVPGRNLAFLVAAAAYAYRRGAGVLVGGMCETDYSGYPDCRRATLDAQMTAINAGVGADFTLETPLMKLTKAETWALACELGGDDLVDLVVEETHTCYRGDRSRRHAWGYGCGTCPACELRAAGFAQFRGPRLQ